MGGLWLNALPAMLFGMLMVLAPLALADAGWSTFAIALVFFVSISLESLVNPLLGRLIDRSGPLGPTRIALTASALVSAGLAAATGAVPIAVLAVFAGVSFGGFYAPGLTLTSHRADAAGLSQGLAFGIMNSAWALGALAGPLLGGAIAVAAGDGTPYLLGTAACLPHSRRDGPARPEEDGRACSVRTGTGATPTSRTCGRPSPTASWWRRSRGSLPDARSTSPAARGRTRSGSPSLGWEVTGVDFSEVAIRKARARAERDGVAVRFVCADLVEYEPAQASYDLVLVMYLHIPSARRHAVHEKAGAAVAPGGTFLLVGHDLTNLTDGVGGPRDPDLLYTAEQIASELPGVEIEKATTVLRDVDGEERDAIDTLVRARRPQL